MRGSEGEEKPGGVDEGQRGEAKKGQSGCFQRRLRPFIPACLHVSLDAPCCVDPQKEGARREERAVALRERDERDWRQSEGEREREEQCGALLRLLTPFPSSLHLTRAPQPGTAPFSSLLPPSHGLTLPTVSLLLLPPAPRHVPFLPLSSALLLPDSGSSVQVAPLRLQCRAESAARLASVTVLPSCTLQPAHCIIKYKHPHSRYKLYRECSFLCLILPRNSML